MIGLAVDTKMHPILPVSVDPVHVYVPASPAPVISTAPVSDARVATTNETAAPAIPASQSVSSSIAPAPQSSSVAASSLPQMVSGIVDPVTGLSYSGYLTPDAQTLYNAGALLAGGNSLTIQGSALAAQGDLITGTPAPTTAQIAAAQGTAATSALSTTDSWAQFTAWLSGETIVAGVPNGAIAAGGVIAAAWLFGGKKRRR